MSLLDKRHHKTFSLSRQTKFDICLFGFFLLTKLLFGVYLVDRFRKHYEVVSYDEFGVTQEKKFDHKVKFHNMISQ